LDRVREKDGKQKLQFFRIDDAFLSPKIDFTKVVSNYDTRGKVDHMDSADILYMDNTMTKEEAQEILKNSNLIAPWKNDQDETWNYQIGDLYGETAECFSFVVYPYSTKVPLDLNYAFLYYVMKDSGAVLRADSPLTEDELKEVKKAR
jgi:hypothetical protein